MSVKSNLQYLLKEIPKKKILIVGDVMVDEYLWGKVERISPEAPVPVVNCTEREYRMGGAANVAINIKSLGAEPILCTVIGNDEIGAIFMNLLSKKGMTDEGIILSDERKSTVKTRVIGNHQQLLRVDHEITSFLDEDAESKLLKSIAKILNDQRIDGLIFQDYDKGVITPSIIESITHFANEKGIPVMVDPKKRSFLNYRYISLFKPNFKELTEGLNVSLNKSDADGIFKAIQILHRENQIKNVMITLSEKGVFISNGKEYQIIPAEEREIADVSGAGDTVIAITALGIASGLDPFQTAALANLAGGIVCEKAGVAPITPENLLAEYR